MAFSIAFGPARLHSACQHARSVVILLVTSVLLAGCDPGGSRRVRVRLHQAASGSQAIAVTHQDLQEALRVLDTVVEPLGFKSAPEQSSNDYICVYTFNPPPVTVGKRSYSRDVSIRVSETPLGIEVAFGDFGFLASTPEPAVRAFKDARAAFISRYGSKNVKTKTFGSVKKHVQATATEFIP